jgi:hypothetical protein
VFSLRLPIARGVGLNFWVIGVWTILKKRNAQKVGVVQYGVCMVLFCAYCLNKGFYLFYLLVAFMVNVTFAVSEELHEIIRSHPEIKWSEIARKAIWEYARKLELMERVTSESRLSEKDALELDKKVKAGLRKRYEGVSKSGKQ